MRDAKGFIFFFYSNCDIVTALKLIRLNRSNGHISLGLCCVCSFHWFFPQQHLWGSRLDSTLLIGINFVHVMYSICGWLYWERASPMFPAATSRPLEKTAWRCMRPVSQQQDPGQVAYSSMCRSVVSLQLKAICFWFDFSVLRGGWGES